MEVCGLPNAEPVFYIFTSIINGGATNRPLSGCAPNLAKTHTFTKLENSQVNLHRATNLAFKMTVPNPHHLLLLKRIKPRKHALDQTKPPALVRLSTLPKMACLRNPYVDASKIDVHFS